MLSTNHGRTVNFENKNSDSRLYVTTEEEIAQLAIKSAQKKMHRIHTSSKFLVIVLMPSTKA